MISDIAMSAVRRLSDRGAPGASAAGSVSVCGNRRSRPPGSIGESGFTTSGMLMRHGCYPVAPTSRWSRSASATAASARPRGTSTPSRTLTRPHSMPSPRCVIDEAQDEHARGCVTPKTPSASYRSRNESVARAHAYASIGMFTHNRESRSEIATTGTQFVIRIQGAPNAESGQMCSLSSSHNASAEFPDLARRHTVERLVRRGRVLGAFGDLRADGDRPGQAHACLRGADAGRERRHRRHAWGAGGSTVLLAPHCSTHTAL